MKKYEVIMDYVMTATIVVEARNEESACNKAARYVHTKNGFERYIAQAAPLNVILDGKPRYGGDDGFDIPCDPGELSLLYFDERVESGEIIDLTKEEA